MLGKSTDYGTFKRALCYTVLCHQVKLMTFQLWTSAVDTVMTAMSVSPLIQTASGVPTNLYVVLYNSCGKHTLCLQVNSTS